MKVIVINRKRLGVTIVIIGLMLILFGAETKFDSRLKQTALMHSNINSLKKYEGLNNTFSYQLPDQWTSSVQNFGGNEVIYHNDFTSQDQIIQGFVQVWNLREDLKSFIEKGRESAFRPAEYKEYYMEPVTIKQFDGFHVSYSVKDRYGNYFRVNQYYLRKEDKVFIFSFSVREQNYKENMAAVFKTIAGTMEYKGSK